MSEKRKQPANAIGLVREAMDKVMTRVTLEEIAKGAGCGVNVLKQSRLDPAATGYRNPPAGLRRALYEVCRARARHFLDLAKQLKAAKGE